MCLVHFELKGEGFDHFRCDRPQTIGINLLNLAKILKCAGNNDVITMKAEDDGDTLTLMFESDKQDRVSDFALKLMTIDCEQLGIPEQEYSVKARVPAAEYQRIMRDLASIGDNTMISATKDGIKFTTTGDIGAANMTLRHSNSADKADEHVVIELEEPVAQSFALRYLNNFAKAGPLSSSVRLGLSKDVPLVVEFVIPDIGCLKYYLAPKIDDEEDMGE